MEQNEELKSHITDLARRSYEHNIYTFSDFLSQGDISQIYGFEREINFVSYCFSGGMEGCERQMIRFGSKEELGYEEEFPIRVLTAAPIAPKYADDLSHRDFLGALMNLGIKREVLGDIVVRDNVGYIFCQEQMAGYIAENLVQVKHTAIACKISDVCPESARPVLQETDLIAASNRCDAIIAGLYNISRNKSLELFRGGCIFVNGRQCENNSRELKEGETVSVRGYGKFVFQRIAGDTRKGRIRIILEKYV